MALTLRLNEMGLQRQIRRFTAQGAKAVSRAVRKVAFDVVAQTTRSLNGATGLPKRIDTGRYRAAWNVAVQAGTGKAPGPTSPTESGDGEAVVKGSGLTQTVTIINNVEYGPYIEHGTEHMRPGNHLNRALYVVTGQIDGIGEQALMDAWTKAMR